MKTDKDAQDGGKREVMPFHKLFSFVDSFDVALMLVGAIGAAVAGAPLPVMAYLFGSTMDALGGHYAKDPQEQLHKMSESSLRCVLVGFIAAVGYFFQISCWTSTGERQADRIRYLYLEALLHQDASFFDQEISTGAAVESMTADAFHIQQATGGKVGKLIQILSTLASGYIVAFTQGWKLTLVISALIPLVMGTGYSMDLMITRTSREAFVATGKAGSIVEQVISAIRTVVAFTGEKKALEAYDTTLKKADRANLQECLASGWGMGAVLFFTFNTYALTLWFGSHLIFQGSYTGGQVITIFFSVIIGTGALGQSSPCLSAFASGTAAAQKIFRVIYRKPTVDINETGLELGELRGQITFKNVKFWYPSRPGQEIFGNLSLDIDAGTTAALVGESGSGKSTVARLIERFYDPQVGEVMVDGVDLRKLKLGWWRMQVGLVSQEPVLFNMSVKENIAYGKEGATDEELEAAATVANAAKFIASLPQGYDTNVGNSGLQLSGGQKQRIAIARAVLKNPRVLLLDEATSSLDAESESLVHQALDQIMLHRTTLIIAHRLTTVKKAQFIAVLDRGVIVEKGTHSELLSNPDGVFSQLVRLEERLKNEEVQKEEDEQQTENPTIIAATHRRKRNRASSRSLSFGSMGSIGSIAQNELDEQIQPCRESSENASSNDEMTSSMIQCSHILRLAAHNKPEIPILFVGSVAAGLNGATMPIVGLLFANILQSFYQPRENVPSACLRWIHLFLVVACVSLILTPLQSVCFSIAGEKLVRRIRLLTFDRILHQEISWFDENVNSSGVISSRLLRDASRVRTMVGDSLALVVQNLTTVVVGLFIAFSTCWQLALLFVALLPFFCLDGMMQIKLGEIFDYKAKAMYDETSRVAHESLSSIRTVASFCAEKKVLQFYKSKSENCVRDGVRRAIIGGLGLAITYVVMFGSLSLSFWVGGRLISQGKVDSRGFIKTFLAIELSAFAVSLSVALAPDFANVKPAITSVFNMLDLKANDINSGTMLKRLKGEVEFQHVQFHYPSRPDAQIFDDLSFTLRAGQTLALVGESGGGKSTVLALVQRFYEPHAGRILLDKVDIKQLQLRWLRRQMGLVSQEPYLFNDTIQSNIEYGLEGEVSQEELQRASEIANAHTFISGLPQGYQSIVGEKGIQLSGGQKQRVAIARAMVRDPKIVLLDEATSALDAESELAVQEALERAALGRSTMVVAHRLSTVRNADLIVVLKDGHIAEQGTHEELIGLEHGLYAALVNISTTTIAKTHE